MKKNRLIYLIVFANCISIVMLVYVATFDKMINFSEKFELTINPFYQVIFPIFTLIAATFMLLVSRNK